MRSGAVSKRKPSKSKHAPCVRAAIPAHTAKLLRPAFPPARDNDSLARTTQISGSRASRTQPAGRAKNYPYAPGCSRCNDDAQNTTRR